MKRLVRILAVGIIGLVTSFGGTAQSLWQSGHLDKYRVFSDFKARKPVKVMHIGDSHITKGFSSTPIKMLLQRKYGTQVSFAYHGINGSTFTSWLQDKHIGLIADVAPDLLIISLGTNDSYTQRFSAENLRAAIQSFIRQISAKLPETSIILTTPPACYLRTTRSRVVGYKKKGRRRRPVYATTTTYTFNANTRAAVNTIKYFGQAEGLIVINLNALIGTKEQAEEWLAKGWMHSDHVHYSETGYTQQGEAMAKALVEAIED